MALNRDLRTDQYGITSLLDNVPCQFHLEDPKDECYYVFPLNYDLNPRGTIRIRFECAKPIEIYISDQMRKPMRNGADKILVKPGELYRYSPIHNIYSESVDQSNRRKDPLQSLLEEFEASD